MGMTVEIGTIVVACVSLITNVIQYRQKKKSNDLDAIRKELELVKALQSSKDEGYKTALENKEMQIKALSEQVRAQTELIEKNTLELKRMQKIVTFLIANGCQDTQGCPNHTPYSLDDIEHIISGDEED